MKETIIEEKITEKFDKLLGWTKQNFEPNICLIVEMVTRTTTKYLTAT